MNSIKKYLSLMCLMTVLLYSCSKDNNEETPNLCMENNFGVLKVTFGDSNVKHGLLVTEQETQNAWDKIVPIGKTSDTLHLKLGYGYIINISSLDNDNMDIQVNTISVSVEQCQESGITVTF